MARKSGKRKEAELFRRIGLSEEGKALATKLQNKTHSPVDPIGTQEDIDLWYQEKVKSLEGIAEADLTPEMRKFLAFMRLKIKEHR